MLREANVIGVVVNGDDHVHDANDAFLDIIGYTRDDVRGRPCLPRGDHAPRLVGR